MDFYFRVRAWLLLLGAAALCLVAIASFFDMVR